MQNNLGGRVDVGGSDDAALLGSGWGDVERVGDASVRRVLGRAALMAGLDVPEELELRIRALAADSLRLRVRVNGRLQGQAEARPGWSDLVIAVPAAAWRREQNDVELEVEGELRVDSVHFVRTRPSAERWN
jgi:hypothetical protein